MEEPTTVDQPVTVDSTESAIDETLLQKTVIEVTQPETAEDTEPAAGEPEPEEITAPENKNTEPKSGGKPDQEKDCFKKYVF